MKIGLAVVAVVVMACGGDSDPDYIIPSTTKCADAETKAALTAYDDVNGSLEFTNSTGMLDSLSVGDILNSGPADAAPHGMLRKITSIDRSGGRVVLQTEEGTLGEAIQKGDFQITKVLSAADFPPNPKMAALGPTITFDNGVRLDFDDVTTNLSTSGNPSIAGSLGLTGHVRFNPIFFVTGRIRNFHVESFEM